MKYNYMKIICIKNSYLKLEFFINDSGYKIERIACRKRKLGWVLH